MQHRNASTMLSPPLSRLLFLTHERIAFPFFGIVFMAIHLGSISLLRARLDTTEFSLLTCHMACGLIARVQATWLMEGGRLAAF